MKVRIWLLSVWVLCSSAWAAEHVSARLVADVASIRPGQTFTLGVVLKIDPQWHVYWTNPGDAGMPTSVEVVAPKGFEVGAIQYPAPRAFTEAGGSVFYGYSDEVMLLAKVKAPGELPGESKFTVDVSWLVCKGVCEPGDVELALTLPTKERAEPANGELFAAWGARVPVPAGEMKGLTVKTDRSEVGGKPLYRVDLRWPGEVKEVGLFPMPSDVVVSEVKVDAATLDDARETSIRFRARPLAGKALPKTLIGVVAYTDSSGQRRGVVVEVPLQ